MALFGKRDDQERAPEETVDVEKAIAAIGARQAFLEALTLHLVTELAPKKRENLLGQLQDVVSGLMIRPPPLYVSSRTEQDFRDELRRATQILIEKSTRSKPTS
jgi:hypothetical protein